MTQICVTVSGEGMVMLDMTKVIRSWLEKDQPATWWMELTPHQARTMAQTLALLANKAEDVVNRRGDNASN